MLTPARSARILADMKPLGEMLKEWRQVMKLTPAEAARRCKMSAQHYWQIENEKNVYLRPTTFRKLSEGTGFPVERLAAAAANSAFGRLNMVLA